MGHSSTGLLGFGVNLGEDFGLDRAFDDPDPDWYDDDLGWQHSAEKKLLEAAGMAAADIAELHDFQYRGRLRLLRGVEFIQHGYGAGGGEEFMLVSKHWSVGDFGAMRIDLDLPDDPAGPVVWALDVLGITPRQPIGWVLASRYA